MRVSFLCMRCHVRVKRILRRINLLGECVLLDMLNFFKKRRKKKYRELM